MGQKFSDGVQSTTFTREDDSRQPRTVQRMEHRTDQKRRTRNRQRASPIGANGEGSTRQKQNGDEEKTKAKAHHPGKTGKTKEAAGATANGTRGTKRRAKEAWQSREGQKERTADEPEEKANTRSGQGAGRGEP